MGYGKSLKRRIAFILCITLCFPIYGIKNVLALSDQIIPAAGDDGIVKWEAKAAVYWNPEMDEPADLATGANAAGVSDLATGANAAGTATASNIITAAGLASDSDAAMGLTPNHAVKNLNTAVRNAEKLSRQMGVDISEVVIYAMNPLVIGPDTAYTVNGRGATIVPWGGRADDERYIFVINGGKLTLDNLMLCPEDLSEAAESKELLYLSDGVLQIGEQVESYGIFEVDYLETQYCRSAPVGPKAGPVPVIELPDRFDFAGEYQLELLIPDTIKEDITVVSALSADQLPAAEFLDFFPVTNTADEWEPAVEEQFMGSRDTAQLTRKSMVVRPVENSIGGRLWLDENGDGVLDADESGIADYRVGLYQAQDLNSVIQDTRTAIDGTYRFTGLEPGEYVVGISTEVIGGTAYLLPRPGITGDNKFETVEAGGAAAAYSDITAVTAESGTTAAEINAGLRRSLSLSLYVDGDYVNRPLGGNVLASGDETRLVVMEADGDPDDGYYKAYNPDAAGLRSALYDIYTENSRSADYIMYFGSDIKNLPVSLFTDTRSPAGASDVTFAALQGRLNILVMTGSEKDPVTDTAAASAPTSNSLITVLSPGERYFGCHLILRNIRHNFNAGNTGTYGVYMNGYTLTLGGDSWQTAATRYFGGSSSGEITPANQTAAIVVYSTGYGVSHFIGGMRTGKLDGDAAIVIHDTSGGGYNRIDINGGGLGVSSVNTAEITGSVTTVIRRLSTESSSGLGQFIGGVEYGTVGGPITNTISGAGRFYNPGTGYTWDSAISCIIGGSRAGNIGSDATLGKADTPDPAGAESDADYIIKNNIDTGAYTYGRAFYCGTNYSSGIVKGNVINLVRAGTYNQGSINVFSGGAGFNAAITDATWYYKFSANPATAKVTNIDAGLSAAKAAAGYQHYGNITNIIYQGSISLVTTDNMYSFRGAGWGYMEGNVYSEVGTEGIVYPGSNNSYSYSSTAVSQGYHSPFDMAGGGGTVGVNASFCIKGDTTLVTREVLARWTYGSNFNGVQIGDSLRVHHGGVVDTCEGTGYNNYIHVGDGRAEVHGGQVDWFLSGGGWNDTYQDGNVSVEVFDGPDVVINGSLGGTYGAGITHYISGDSAIVVHGGDFSGTARADVYRGFAAGPTYAGYIYGNASVTVDLRGNQYGFAIEAGDSISGGRRLAAGAISYLGTDADNTITLNILADESQTDLLNGLNIYGDCALVPGYADRTRSGHIIINVNAPGANLGNLYASNYTNISSGVLRRDVEVNLVSAGTLTGLCAGFSGDDITNTIAAASTALGRRAVINVGPQSDDPAELLGERESGGTPDGLPYRINISTNGLIGFTEMDIKKRLLVAQQGNILNGLNAAAANHGTTYDQFGTLVLHAGSGMEGAGLGISDSSSLRFIAGSTQVTGSGRVYIESRGQADQIVLTDISIDSDSAVMWMKIGNADADTNLQTNWFGAESGWRVITLNPDKTAAAVITPVNFIGFEKSAGKTFIGDSDTHFSGNYGYAVALSGTVYEWEVTAGNGKVSHNVPVSTSMPSAGEAIYAYGTAGPDTPAIKGAIAVLGAVIPDLVPYPVFSFIPDSAGGWVSNVDIYGSDQYISASPHIYQIGTGGAGETKTWAAGGDDTAYSFMIEAQFAEPQDVVNLTVSKRVEGDYADLTRDFTFTVYFQNEEGTALAEGTSFPCQGSIIPGIAAESPANGIMTLDSRGSAALVLKHGQQITVSGLLPGMMRVIETTDSNYSTVFLDGRTGSRITGTDTGLVDTDADLIFAFTNTRNVVVPAGIKPGDYQGLFILPAAMFVMMSGFSVVRICYRRKRSW